MMTSNDWSASNRLHGLVCYRSIPWFGSQSGNCLTSGSTPEKLLTGAQAMGA
jgi:hypothetical protein